MKCCILSCKNYSDKRSDGITFHLFPTEENLKQQWITKINREDWTPTKHTKICSCHFNNKDFITTNRGLRKLKKGTLPCRKLNVSLPNDMDNYMEYQAQGSLLHVHMKPERRPTRYKWNLDRLKKTSDDAERSNIHKQLRNTMHEQCKKDFKERTVAAKQVELRETSSEISVSQAYFDNAHKTMDKSIKVQISNKVCRVCLVDNLPLYMLVNSQILDVYEILTKVKLSNDKPVTLCHVCLTQLRKCHRFMQRAQESIQVLERWHFDQTEFKPLPLFTYTATNPQTVDFDDLQQQISDQQHIKNKIEELEYEELFDEENTQNSVESEQDTLNE